MPDLCFLVCESFAAEANAVVASEGFGNVRVVTFPSRCGRPPIGWDELAAASAGCSRAHVLGGCCAPSATAPGAVRHIVLHRFDQCFQMLAAKEQIEAHLRSGAYLVTPGWLGRWPAHAEQWGLDQETARELFGESSTRVLLLDTGIDPDSLERLRAFATYVGRPYEVAPVGLDHLRLHLTNIVLRRRLEGQADPPRSSHPADRVSDYAMAMDLLSGLAREHSEDAVVSRVLDLALSLYAPAEVHYLPLAVGEAGEVRSRVSNTDRRPTDPAIVRNHLAGLEAGPAWTESDDGFCVRILHGREPVGVLEIVGLAFPEHRNHYLNLTLGLVDICGLAVGNARAFTKLQSAERYKQELLSVAAHELRSPLTVIHSSLDWLAETKAPFAAAHSKVIETAVRNSQRMARLINDLLDVEAAESGRLSFDVEPLEIMPLVERAIELNEARARSLGVSFATAGAVPGVKVNADAERLIQVLTNLLSNAAKFSPEGGTVSVSISRRGPSVRVAVEDHGPGVPEELRTRIFEKFSRGASDDLRHKGSGLGLAISKAIVEALGGQIGFETVEAIGSTFYVELAEFRDGTLR